MLRCPFFIIGVLYFFVIGLVGLCCKPQPFVIIIIIIITSYFVGGKLRRHGNVMLL